MSLFCLVHGANLGAWCWDLLIPELEARGHKAVAMDLPIDNPTATFSDFADAVMQAIPAGEDDVILVGHSFAGAVIPLVANQRPVRRLVYLGALIPHPGMRGLDQFYDELDPDALKAIGYEPPPSEKFEQFSDEPDMYNPACLRLKQQASENPDVAMEFCFHDCEPDVARWGISKLRYQASFAYLTEVFPLQALPDVESVYIVGTQDRIISPEWSRYAARKRLGVDAVELPAGHYPQISHPAQLAEILTK
ncbi:MAG: alpha/beta fold hydrolase [Nostocaceae cyanobacterium]|nr:alpha/beta fold hydrolase [Nostocaceae cyanobacterium]